MLGATMIIKWILTLCLGSGSRILIKFTKCLITRTGNEMNQTFNEETLLMEVSIWKQG